MKFILIDEVRRNNAIDHLQNIDITKPIEVFIRPYKKNRTRAQNSTIWMWYEVIGDYLGMSSEDLHELMKVRVLGIEEKTINGELIRTPKSSAKLSTREMADFMTAIEVLAIEFGLKLPYPDDYKHATFKEK